MRACYYLTVLLLILPAAGARAQDLLPEQLYMQIGQADQRGDRAQAHQLARQFIETFPDSPQVEEILYQMPLWAQTWDDFIQDNQEYLGRYPERVEATVAAQAVLNALSMQRQYPQMLTWLAEHATPLPFTYENLSGISRMELDRQINAQRWQARALAATGQYQPALQRLDNLNALERLLPQIWATDPDLGDEVLLLKGNCYLKLGDYRRAQRFFDTLLRTHPSSDRSPGALWGFAECARLLGQESTCHAALERITRSWPHSPEAALANYTLSQGAH